MFYIHLYYTSSSFLSFSPAELYIPLEVSAYRIILSAQAIMVDPIPPEKWEEHKGEILRLYIYEDLPLKHVMKRVRTRDFHPEYVIVVSDMRNTKTHPSESQYRSKLKTWRQRKARKSRKARHKPTENAPE